MSKLVIGVGNVDRGDDAAGVLVARAVRGLRSAEVNDCARLIDVWEREKDVVVVDAMRTGSTPGTVLRIDPGREPLPARAFPSTHAFGLAETVELARTLGRLPGQLTIYGIEAGKLGIGSGISSAVREAIGQVVAEIERDVA